MSRLIEFKALVDSYDEGSFTARLVPFGVEAPYGAGVVEFQMGSLEYGSSTPLTVDHSDSVFDRVGVMVKHFESKDGAYGEFQLSDTEAGRTMRTLLLDGAVTDVSVGVRVDSDDEGVMFGELDHVSLVSHGRFGRTENPSRVLAVHDDKEPFMGEEKVETAPVVEQFDDSELRAEIVRLSEQVDTMENRVVSEPTVTFGEVALAMALNQPLEEFQLATEDTTVAAGVVPDYLSSEIVSIIDTTRPFVASFQNDPIGSAGMSVIYPQVTQKPSAGIQASELDVVNSTQMIVGTQTWNLRTHAGANQISLQLIERSSPSFMSAYFAELAGVYAISTETIAIADAFAAVTQQQLLADASTDAAATIAALAAANTQIINGVRRPATDIWVGSTRWEEFLSLVDAGGRPIVVWPGGNPGNAFGTASLSVMTGTISGLRLTLVPNMGATDMMMGWAGGAANLEQSPTQLRVQQVDTLSIEAGVYGLFRHATKYPTAFVEFTLV